MHEEWRMLQGRVKRRARAVATVIAVVALLIAMRFVPIDAWTIDLVHALRERGVLGALTFGAVYVAAMLVFIPAWALTVGAGSAYGPLGGALFVVPVSTLGASFAFVIGRRLGRRWAEHEMIGHPWFLAVDRAVEHNGFKIVVLMRLALVFPFNILNYALGTSRIRFKDFFFGSLIGTVPGTLLYTYLGSIAMRAGEATAPLGAWRWALYAAGALLAAATVGLTVRYARRELDRELARASTLSAAQP
jgi:uncharacterized membrane protein YdjX (TVP38/TMEM64 family)